jgi:hypothetical protein
MSDRKQTILESWPMLKEDLVSFLSDTDAWVVVELKKASAAEDWRRVNSVIDLMDTLHNMSHSH